MQSVFRYGVIVLVGYLLGSFPTGYLMARWLKGVDPRKYGSGRTGGTNILRSAGRGPALLTVAGDLLKGIIAVLLARTFVGTHWSMVLAGLAAVLGHNRSIFLGFHGGAGAMTNVGVVLALSPVVLAPVIIVAVPAALLTKTASLATIAAAVTTVVSFAALYMLHRSPLAYVVYSVAAFALILFELRPNIRRLLAGTERKVESL